MKHKLVKKIYWTFLSFSICLVLVVASGTAYAQVGWQCPDEPAGAPLYQTLNACRNSPCPSACVLIDNTVAPPQPEPPAQNPNTPPLITPPQNQPPPQRTSGSCDPTKQFCNPISANTFGELVQSLASAVVAIAIPIVVVFLVYAGFLFVSARGNEKQLTTAKQTFYWTIVGAAVVVGAYALSSAIVHFAQSLGG